MIAPLPRAGGGEAHIWQVDLRSAGGNEAQEVLSPSEHARAARFVFDRDRRRFVAGRIALRSLLAAQLRCGPKDIELEATEHGRPLCPALQGQLDFNLSNSNDLAIIALTSDAPVGVDVECLRSMPDAIELSRHYFSSSETESLERLDGTARDRAFLACWTRKEAVLKAIGLGLHLDPACIPTGILEQPMTVPTPHGTFEITTFAIDRDAVATLATPHAATQLHLHRFQPAKEQASR